VTPPPDPCLLLYDAGCPLCRSAARFALSHTGVPPIRAIPLQSAEAAALLSSCRLPGDPDGTVVVMDDGKPYVRSEALLRIAARLPFPWRLLALARILPRRLRDSAYDAIASRRHLLFGRLDGLEGGARQRK